METERGIYVANTSFVTWNTRWFYVKNHVDYDYAKLHVKNSTSIKLWFSVESMLIQRWIYVDSRLNQRTWHKILFTGYCHGCTLCALPPLQILPPFARPPLPLSLPPSLCISPLTPSLSYAIKRLMDLTYDCKGALLVYIPKVSTTFHQWALRLFPYIAPEPIILLLSDINTILCNHKANAVKTFILQNIQGLFPYRQKIFLAVATYYTSALNSRRWILASFPFFFPFFLQVGGAGQGLNQGHWWGGEACQPAWQILRAV